MSKTYDKEVTYTHTHTETYIMCDKCAYEVPMYVAIDSWCIIDGDNYCTKCQKMHKVGWYEKS